MTSDDRWFLIELGCAECGDMPLALPRGVYATEEDARAAAVRLIRGMDRERWIPHPVAGSFAQWGSGGVWCAPVWTLSAMGGEFGSKYDVEFRAQ